MIVKGCVSSSCGLTRTHVLMATLRAGQCDKCPPD